MEPLEIRHYIIGYGVGHPIYEYTRGTDKRLFLDGYGSDWAVHWEEQEDMVEMEFDTAAEAKRERERVFAEIQDFVNEYEGWVESEEDDVRFINECLAEIKAKIERAKELPYKEAQAAIKRLNKRRKDYLNEETAVRRRVTDYFNKGKYKEYLNFLDKGVKVFEVIKTIKEV